MAVTAKWYGNALIRALTKEVGWLADDIRVQLHSSGYTPDQDAHVFRSHLSNELPTANGYTAGGIALASKTLTYTGATNVITLDAADVSWSNATLVARYAVILDNTPATDATRPLLGYVDFGADVSSTAAPFTITWDAAGILTITPA